jgi:hypothetical protein
MSWLSSFSIWILIAVTPGGLESQLAVYPTSLECEAARERLKEEIEPSLQLQCRERVRTSLGR